MMTGQTTPLSKAESAALAADEAVQERPPTPDALEQVDTAADDVQGADGAPAGTQGPKPKRRRRARTSGADQVDAARRHRVCAGYYTTARPDGVPVTFIPGEALPAWVDDDAPTT